MRGRIMPCIEVVKVGEMSHAPAPMRDHNQVPKTDLWDKTVFIAECESLDLCRGL